MFPLLYTKHNLFRHIFVFLMEALPTVGLWIKLVIYDDLIILDRLGYDLICQVYAGQHRSRFAVRFAQCWQAYTGRYTMIKPIKAYQALCAFYSGAEALASGFFQKSFQM